MNDLDSVRWLGYGRKDGKIGIRNRVLVIYTVKCAEHVAREIVFQCHNTDVEMVGFDGCTDNQFAVSQIVSLIRHPNVGAVLAVGLGCEYMQPQWYAEIAQKSGKNAEWFSIQEKGGTLPSIEYGVSWIRTVLEELKKTPRVEMGFKDLVIGAECGGSDYTSGLAGNAVVGRFFDRLVDAKGTAIFEEIVEAIGLDELLTSRAASEKARQEIQYTYDKACEYCRHVNQYSISPGNFAGGLTTIEEKSMGAVVKSGSKPIEGVIKVSVQPPHPGLWLLDSTPDPHFMDFGITNPSDNEGLMDLTSCGAHLVFLITGRGSVIGNAIAPCIKITGNYDTYNRMIGDMDFNSGRMLAGECTPDECTDDLAELVRKVASGEMSKSEKLGHKEFHILYKYQEKSVLPSCMMKDN